MRLTKQYLMFNPTQMQKYSVLELFVVTFHVVPPETVKTRETHVKTRLAFLKILITTCTHNLTFAHRIVEREHTLVLVDHIIAGWYFYAAQMRR